MFDYKNACQKLFLFIAILIITACTTPPIFNQTEGNVADVAQRNKEAIQKSDRDAKPAAPLVIKQGLYVDRTPVDIMRNPRWMRNHIILRGDQLPFSYYSRTVAAGGGGNILTRYQVGLDPATPVTVNYEGTVRGALDVLSARTGFVYTVQGNNVYWQSIVTKTFDVAFMPGSSDYLMGKKGGGSSGGAATPGGGSSSGTTVSGIDDSSAAQYSNLKGTLSIWDDLKNTIQQMLSPDGKVIVSQATTSVTVRDKPSVVSLVSKYVDNLNKNLTKQVLVKVQVLEVDLSSNFNYGINWNIVQGAFGGSNYLLNANNGEPISFTNILGSTAVTQAGLQMQPNRTTGFTTLVNALKQQGKVSVVSEPRVVCLNNQVSVIRIVNQEGYLASIQNTTVGGATVGGSTVTSQVTPGTLVTGLTLYVLPKIMNNKVYMQVNADLSSSNGFTFINSTPDPNSPNASQIQVPNVTQKQFNQRSVIASGDTLILSGFRRVTNNAAASQLFEAQSLGGQAAAQLNTETIVLITPIILSGFNS